MQTLVNVTLPEMGESVSEGSIVEWRKKPGDWVEEGETLVDVTTDKVDVEVPSTASGIVTAVHGAEGDTVNVGSVLVEIDTTAAKPEGATRPAEPVEAPPGRPAEATLVTPSGYGSAGAATAPAETRANGKQGGVLSHHARRLVERLHIDAAKLQGSGPDGLILREDVEAAVASGKIAFTGGLGAASAAPAVQYPPIAAQTKVSDLKGSVATLAQYMEQSLTIPVATSFRTLHVGTLEQRRIELNAALKLAGRTEKVSFTHIIAFALARAAREQPAITVSFRRTDGKPQKIDAGVNLGLAVDAQKKDGSRFLVVPVIKNAASLDFGAFRNAYEDLVAKARDNKLSVEEQTGATFTLTNPGGIGTVASVPRLMVGQGAIIAAGAIAYPPGLAHAPKATLAQLGVEKVMTLTSTYDHRVVQGAQSGEYLKRVDELLAGADEFYETIFSQLGLTAAVRGSATDANAAAPAAAREAVAPVQAGEFAGMPSEEMLRAIAAGMAVVSAYRRHGHLAATLDPLGSKPPGDPSLDPATYNLTPAMMHAIPASVLRVKVPGNTLADVLPKLRETYSSTIAYEIEHISNTQQREWLREYIETGMHRRPLTPQRRVQVLQRLTKVETMERYFRKQFMSQKTFSIEGLDVMVPMLEETISMLAEDGTQTAVIGMAHRGRLSTIAHVVNRPYEELLAEFEQASQREELASPESADSDSTGDVKYHHGAEGTYETPNGTKIRVELAHNPSHLEAVDGVVEGMTRALQTDHTVNPPTLNSEVAAPILIHGDAAFAAQGIVAEVLNLQGLAGYATGGTIHIISNNQVGFTTDPSEARSTRYASDLAKGYDLPIVHVNADDVDACIAAVHLGIDYRRKFSRDVIVDLIGYRRFGHNEQDEPAYTQPQMVESIKAHPTVRELYAAQLVAQGILSQDQVKELQDVATARITDAHRRVKSGEFERAGHTNGKSHHGEAMPKTSVNKPTLMRFADAVVSVPEGFALNKKLQSQFAKRTQALRETGEVDWGLAEALAFASLLSEGTPIRISGQDTERGTFSHRHAVLHDAQTNAKYVPLQHLADAKASFEIYNSPLSEYACLGFEYGYGAEIPHALVLWEAQFGDFNNGAQIIIDQFIAAGAAKWGQSTRLTLLLPHGYEGAGPEHSSARIERFLQLSAEGNIRVANCSTAAQYFHLLRAQARAQQAYPLVVMTPKSLLRNRAAYGTIDELAGGSFREVIDDPRYEKADKSEVTRLLLCSGHVYYDLTSSPLYADAKRTAIARVEMLSPLPRHEILALIGSYPNLEHAIWVQEEPKNMGARAHVRRRVVENLPPNIADLEYIGRPYRASPSEGYPGAHAVEQERIVRQALTE
ncbi:alpha-ketoglutarate decarboxylase [Vulcanimicrobium alpinum]|uniref:oxoglutarate dehydrogenase (succinyl-transferring) n=1 Tax=Vulcanimicrobium alpinum TaxID=3016050 RepID=A0AAN1XZ63_UNVUL|nr:multifunctional oxoglutarate decarboxylase/oxoglutarate dehydrogenase thiamine pyrophosphate-binding subunit/dihydrolipoyllysine-residue succinyltransferase subunit [Vulcanimicrobium alpinum]BDE08056.1 alpha-ketoglutarate decarboxylase [Vulcanimicrobium alpinum]